MKLRWSVFICFLFTFNFYAQLLTTIKGDVLNKKDNEIIENAIITILSASKSTIVNTEGKFFLETWLSPPFDIRVSAIGFKDYYYTITSKEEKLNVVLEEEVTDLNSVVISASRTPEHVFESPVTVEILSSSSIENTTSPTFYDGLENLKGINVNTSSYGFKSVNTRGFTSFGNVRFVQLVDGMDNASPGLNFSVGNLVGLNDLDVKSVEVLPGASSALYGANAFNGIMFMKSKSPFIFQGTSVYGKTGITNSDNSGVNEFFDVGVRSAKKINDRLALKFTASYFKAAEWRATDERNINSEGRYISGDRNTDIAYNGVNVYGDETLGENGVSRTGYKESDLVDYDTDSFKTSFSAHFKPSKHDDTELIYSSKFGTGNTIYHDVTRIALRDFIMHQHKIELQSEHLMARVYATFENAGNSYDIRFAGINTLNAVNSKTDGETSTAKWHNAYNTNFATTSSDALARKAADDAYRLSPSDEEFKQIFNQIIQNPDLSEGAKFIDKSRMYHSDVNYKFKDLIEFADVQVGGSLRKYVLDSEGSVFTDDDGVIHHHEIGIYTQLQKSILDDKIKLTGSLRFDKSDGFEGNISPRFSVLYALDEDQKHNIRASFQTGFRNPTTQEQYLGVFLGNAVTLGAAKGNAEKYDRKFVTNAAGEVDFNGSQAYSNSYTRESVESFSEAVQAAVPGIIVASGGTKTIAQASQEAAFLNAGLLQQANTSYVKPEEVLSYEIGYRGKLTKKTELDFSAYFLQYKNLISDAIVIAPLYGNVTDGTGIGAVLTEDFVPVSIASNISQVIASYGASVGVHTKVFRNYNLGFNYTYNDISFDQAKDESFEAGFNTPKHRAKLSVGNTNAYKGLGFGLDARWQDAFYWESNYVDGVIPARFLLDLQLSYYLENLNSKIKLGAANLLGNNYISAPGAGVIGSQLYASWRYTF